MGFKDVIKSSILDNFQNVDITMKSATLFLTAACLLGIYIFIIYKLFTANAFYSKSFNVSLVLMCVITAAIIITIQSSIVVSLGMVGALSIVRFRTAIKDPMDLVFLFWSISMGIIAGAGMLGLSIIASVMITALLFVFHYMPERKQSLLLMINASSNQIIGNVLDVVKKYDKKCHIQSRNINQGSADILIEVNLLDGEEILNELSALDGVYSVSLISNKGESVF